MLRAIMEGCAFAVYDNLQIAEEHGVLVDEFLGPVGQFKARSGVRSKRIFMGNHLSLPGVQTAVKGDMVWDYLL